MSIDFSEKIEKNFYLRDFFVSKDHPDVAKKMIPSDEALSNIKRLANIVQLIRNELNEKVFILSGYRSRELNMLVSKSSSSDHMLGAAADITSSSIQESPSNIAKRIWNLKLNIRQIIYYPNNGFIHISINTMGKIHKRELLKFTGGTSYELKDRLV